MYLLILDVYLGDLDDETFDFEDGDYTGNIPKRISNYFPESHESFWFVLKQLRENNIIGKQTDWGAWVIIIYPKEILEMFVGFYDEDDFNSLKKIIKKLNKNKQYGLVAREFW